MTDGLVEKKDGASIGGGDMSRPPLNHDGKRKGYYAGSADEGHLLKGQISPEAWRMTAAGPADRQSHVLEVAQAGDGQDGGQAKPSTTLPSGGASWKTWHDALASEVVYCLVSAGTILFNKHALSTFHFPAPNTLLFFQFLMAVVLLKVSQMLGIVHLEPLRWDMIRMWFPVRSSCWYQRGVSVRGGGSRGELDVPTGCVCMLTPLPLLLHR